MRKTILVCLVMLTSLCCSRECSPNVKQKSLVKKDLGGFIVTFYDNCELCTLKDASHPAYGITASGEQARQGYVACNWLPFGTMLEIEGLGVFTVKDRGAKSLFGTHKKPIKRIDVWVPSHAEARKLGKQMRRVALLKKGEQK